MSERVGVCMIVKDLELTNFRNHKKIKLTFDPKVNLIMGANGSGKTNILEALNLLSSTKSFRARYDKDAINHGADFCKVVANVVKEDDTYSLECQILKTKVKDAKANLGSDTDEYSKEDNTSSKKVKVNKIARSLNNFAGILNTVLFSPEQIEILTGSPGGRRRYTDMVLFQIDKPYKKAISDYTKALRQRNKILELLSVENRGWDQIDFWDEKLVETGTIIQTKRTEYYEFIKENIFEYGKELNATNTRIEVLYKPSELNMDSLSQNRRREIAAQTTFHGPHRDDVEIYMDGFYVAQFGSRGQQRAAILALKLAEIDFFSEKTEEKPVLLLDDIFSEFDEKHKTAVTETIKDKQTIITSADQIDLKTAQTITI